jgi:wobble nucleotide-excising tRNase
MLTEEEIEEQIKKKTEQLINTIREMIKTKNINVSRITDKGKEQLEITLVLETGNTIKEVLDIYEERNKKGQTTNICLLSTPRIVTMSYLFGYLDSDLIKGRFDTLK